MQYALIHSILPTAPRYPAACTFKIAHTNLHFFGGLLFFAAAAAAAAAAHRVEETGTGWRGIDYVSG
jgi:hypothetical protein